MAEEQRQQASPAPTTTGGSGGGGVPAGWNQKNPAIRRIMADIRELARDPSDQYAAKPVDENMFEWHFVIRGPKGTDFEGGKYHGKILLPAEYPFKPPNIVFLTPNGRWETKTKICLSMSAYHPEDWQPAWGIRTMLEALISFMPSPSDGALGAVDCTPEQRKRLALESQSYTHPLMPQLPEEGSCTYSQSKENAEAIAQMQFQAAKEPAEKRDDGKETPAENVAATETAERPVPVETGANARAEPPQQQEQQQPVAAQGQQVQQQQPVSGPANAPTAELPSDFIDDALRITSWAVLLAIFVLAYRKLLMTFAPEL